MVSCSSEPGVDPLAVTNSVDITDISDNTGTGWYTVTGARLSSTSLGTTLRLRFDVIHPNGTAFSPVSTVTFADGTRVVCEADDPRRVPSLQASTTEWDFACDASSFPEASAGARLVVVDDYR
jgi:hypothetical protein